MNKIILDCSKCGGALDITDDMELFKCPYCGVPYMVERSEGSVRIVKLEQRVDKLEVEQRGLRAKIELDELLAKREEVEQLHKEKGKGPLVAHIAIGALIGAVPGVLCFAATSSSSNNDLFGFSYCVFATGLIVGVSLGFWRLHIKYGRPYNQAMQESRKREAELRAIVSETGYSLKP